MVLCRKLWFYTENFWTSIYERKNVVDYQNKDTLIYYGEKNGNFPKQFQILNKFIALEFTKTMVLWRNYGTIEKLYTIVNYR